MFPHKPSQKPTRKPNGYVTRGTTNPNRLRRVDRWVNHTYGHLIRHSNEPLLVDLGYGAYSVTTKEWFERTKVIRDDIAMIGIEIDPDRVKQAQADAQPNLEFIHGGFEIPTTSSPLIIRAFNVLRQYEESEVSHAWKTITQRLSPEGVLIEGTCDEVGRIAVWVTLTANTTTPSTLTFACNPQALEKPSQFAERLPKALIHHNISGEPIHQFLTDWDISWHSAAPMGVFGARQRWQASLRHLRTRYPMLQAPPRLGAVTIPWEVIAP